MSTWPIIGCTISRYRILEKLGGGGMGAMYKAEAWSENQPERLRAVG